MHSPRGATLARFKWSNLGLDYVLLGRESLLQEAVFQY
jgi:hypothetical protein